MTFAKPEMREMRMNWTEVRRGSTKVKYDLFSFNHNNHRCRKIISYLTNSYGIVNLSPFLGHLSTRGFVST